MTVTGPAPGRCSAPLPGRLAPGTVRPQPLEGPASFLLDVHLGTLARRLRLLGVDAAYEREAGDDQLADVVQRFRPPLQPWRLCPVCGGTLAAVPEGSSQARLPAPQQTGPLEALVR